MIKRKKSFREVLNFSKAEMRGDVRLNAVGISMNEVNIDLARDQYKRQKNWLQFGMLGNDPKFDQNVTMQDVMPKEEDFVEKPFRLLSATTVGAGTWKATDFSDETVLQLSAPKLDGKPLYKDHETDLDNWVGLVNGVKWTEGYTSSNGTRIPAGIDGIVAIDAKTNPKVARGVLMGSVYSNSVTVAFDWEMSHSFENPNEFYQKIGTLGKDGKMIRRIVTKIHDYHESSLVWLGADPFAKAIEDNGDLKNIDASSIYEFAKVSFNKSHPKVSDEDETITDEQKKSNQYSIGFSMDKSIAVLSAGKPTIINNKKTNEMKKFLAAFIATFGQALNLSKTEEELAAMSEDEAKQLLASLAVAPSEEERTAIEANRELVNNLNTQALAIVNEGKPEGEQVESIDLAKFTKDNVFVGKTALDAYKQAETDLAQLKTEKETLEGKVAKLAKDAKVGEEFTKMKREEAVRLYKTHVGPDKASEAVIKMFKDAEGEALDGLLNQYTSGVTHKFKGKCAECNSENFKFQSSLSTEGKEDTLDFSEEDLDVSADSIRAQFSRGSMNIGRHKN